MQKPKPLLELAILLNSPSECFMDNTLRDLERQLKQNPDDTEVITKIAQARIRMGKGETKSFYKIKNTKGEYLCPEYPPVFAPRGSKRTYKNKAAAIKVLERSYQLAEQAINASKNYRGTRHETYEQQALAAKQFLEDCATCSIVKYQSVTIEVESEPLDIVEEKKRIALDDIRKQRAALEKKEQALLKEEQVLLGKITKKKAAN